MYSSCKIWKKTIDNASFFAFSYHWTSNLAQILPLRPHSLSSFVLDFQWNMLGNSIDINSFCCNQLVPKKNLVKTSKNCFFGPNLQYRGQHRPCPKWKTIFLAEITKADHQISETFYFIKISSVAELWIFFYFVWCFFNQKKVISSSKTAFYWPSISIQVFNHKFLLMYSSC